MFTGMVESTARVTAFRRTPEGAEVELDLSGLPGLGRPVARGDSVAIDGCCLTAVRVEPPLAVFQAVPETLDRTNLSRLAPGARCNVERALRFGDRLGGHLVAGHVDGVAQVVAADDRGSERRLEVQVGEALRPYLLEKGSVALDGVSLTIAAKTGDGCVVALIPHTRDVTTLGARRPGDHLNVEVDLIGKWLRALLSEGRLPRPVDLESLARAPLTG